MTKQICVGIVGRFEAHALAWLQSHSNFQVQWVKKLKDLKSPELLQGLVVRSDTEINEASLKGFERLQMVVTATSGFDHFDFAFCENRNIACYYTPDANITSTAELTFSHILSVARNIPLALKMGKLPDWSRSELLGFELEGKALSIVGFGRVGSRVARYARAFGMKLYAYDPYIEPELALQQSVELVGFEEAMRVGDIVSFHVPLTKETKHMVNRRTLEWISDDAAIVNCSRGGVINEFDLAEAVKNKNLRTIALDVFENEPLRPASPLLALPSASLTPHMASLTVEAFNKSSMLAAQKLVNFFDDKELSDKLPPLAPWYQS